VSAAPPSCFSAAASAAAPTSWPPTAATAAAGDASCCCGAGDASLLLLPCCCCPSALLRPGSTASSTDSSLHFSHFKHESFQAAAELPLSTCHLAPAAATNVCQLAMPSQPFPPVTTAAQITRLVFVLVLTSASTSISCHRASWNPTAGTSVKPIQKHKQCSRWQYQLQQGQHNRHSLQLLPNVAADPTPHPCSWSHCCAASVTSSPGCTPLC
jgi:hypothetical protein